MSERITSVSERVYRRLIAVYPLDFRRRYGREMLLLFRDRRRELMLKQGRSGLFSLWAQTLGDLILSAPAEHLARRENMSIAYHGLLSALKLMFKYGLRAFLVLVIAVALWLPIGNALANRSERKVNEAWAERTGINSASLVEKCSQGEANESADYVDQLSARLYDAADHPFGPVARTLYGFLKTQLRRPDDQIDEPPPEAKEYLAAHESDISDLHQRIGIGDAPVWKLDSRGGSLPRWYLLQSVETLIGLEVLKCTRENRDEDAMRAFDVLWKLNRSLLDRPDLIAQLIGISLAETQMGLLRKMHDVPEEWQARVVEHDFTAKALDAIQIDSYLLQLTLKSSSWDCKFEVNMIFDKSRLLRELSYTPIGRPYARLCVADNAATQLRSVSMLRALDVYSANYEALTREDARSAAWNLMSAHSFPARTWRTAVVCDLQAELTARVLRAKALQKLGGDWLRQLPKSDSSRYGQWVCSSDQSNSVLIDLKNAPDWLSKTSGQSFAYTISAER